MASSMQRLVPNRAMCALALLTFLLGFIALSSQSPAAKKHHPRTPPSSYWGGWIGSQLTGEEPPQDMNAVSKFAGLSGKALSLVEFSAPFANCYQNPCTFLPFPTDLFNKVRNYGAIPFFSWASQSTPSSLNQPDFQLSDVANGAYDDYIRSVADAARNWAQPFFLRFDWEMTGDWFPWSEGVNGNQPGEFVAAWRHVHDIFTQEGATNATWVWCPLVSPHNSLKKLRRNYPGNAYVDWTCLDGYNWGPTPANPHPWKSFDKIFKTDYQRVVTKIARKKPMVLAELGSNSVGGNKGAWIQGMFKQLATNYRKVRGLIWFDQVDRRATGDIDWPLETDAGALAAWSRNIQKPAYQANNYGGLSGGPIGPPG